MTETEIPQYRDVKPVVYGDIHPEFAKQFEEDIEWFIKNFGEHPLDPCSQ